MKELITLLSIFALSTGSLVQAQEPFSLDQYLSKVRERNLEIKSEGAKAEGAEAKASGPSIPPPMFGISQMKEEMGNTAKGFEISQTIPFPTKITGDYSARKYAAKSQNETRLAQEALILAKAKGMYFSLWSLQEKLKLLIEKQKIIYEHVKLSKSTARSDNFAAVHVLKTESDLDLLENEITETQQILDERRAELAGYVNEDPNSFDIKTVEPPLSLKPKSESLEDSPQLRSMKFSLESFKARETEAKSSWLPDFNLRFKEMTATSMAGKYNEIMVGVTLPFLFFWEPNSNSRAAISERSQAEFELAKTRRDISVEKANLQTKADSLRKRLDLLKDKLIPRAEKRMKVVHNLAPRDMETLQDHRDTMEALPDLKLKVLELRLAYEDAVANLEKFASQKEDTHE